jgi:hypothetical protein
VSALFKYQGLTFLGVSVGMLGWALFLGRISRMRALGAAVVQGLGALLPAALYLGWCASAGNAEAAVYWFKFNFSYVGAGLSGSAAIARAVWRLGLIGGVALVPYALGLWGAASTAASAVRTGRARRQGAPISKDEPPRPSDALGLLWLATSAVALAAGGRFFGHYFHLVLAPLCVLAAPRFVELWFRGRAFRGVLVALCALPALIFFALGTWSRPLAATLDEGEPRYQDVATRIAALTKPDERIFVWGNSPQLYVSSRRPMGARFSFCNYMTGESPGTPTETGLRDADSNQLPEAWTMLFADLNQRRPALFVDAAAAHWDGYEKFPLSRYPRLRSYVDQHYRRVETRDGVVLYRRVP